MIIKTDLISKITDEIAPKYFDGDEYSEITKSRIGLFGMISETLGTIFENSTINNAIKARERMTSTASRETLLQEAAGYSDLTIPKAQPASITISLGIPTSYMETNFMTSSTELEFVLAADTIVTIADYNFLLDYDVKVTGKKTDGVMVYSAKYVLGEDNDLSSTTNPYLVSSKRTISNIEYLFVTVTVSQLDKTYQYYNIVETDLLYLNGVDFKYDGQLAYFNVYYKDASSSTYTKVEKLDYFSKLTSDSNYIYYNNVTSGVLRIYIPDTFTYSFNSELRIDIYTTQGAAGNFTYKSGDVEILPQSFEDSYDYTGAYFYPVVVTDSTGGTDELSTEEIRKKLIYYKSTLRSIDTEPDLNAYFESIDTIDNMVFIKKRIDVFEKKYTAFMILRDANSNILPTNALNMHLTESDVDAYYVQTKRRIIKPSAGYSLKSGEYFTVVKNTGITSDNITTLENDTTKFLFGCPYLIVINEDPMSASLYLNSVTNTNAMQLEYSNETAPVQFIINRIQLDRNAISGEDYYTLKVNLVPASQLPDGIVDSDGNIIDATALKACGLMYSEDGDNVISGYFNLDITSYNKTDNYFTAVGKLYTDDYISLEDQLRLTDSIYAPGDTTTFDYVTPVTDVRLGIAVYYKDGTGAFTEKGDYADLIPNMEEYGLLNIYSNDNDRASVLLDMTKMINVVLSFQDEGNGVISFDLKQVPLIRYSDLRTQVSRIAEVIANTNTTINSMLELIKNNASIDFKFFATYGRSKYFTVGETSTTLDRLNLSLKFRVRISSSRVDTTLVSDIRAYIKSLVEEINSSSSTKSIYFSNIVTQVENEFKYTQARILSFELYKINDYDVLYQAIVNNTKDVDSMTQDELLDYVGEFVTLDLDKITIDIVTV